MIETNEFKEVKSFLINAKWRFAKSMPKIPHSYTRKSEWENKEDFEKTVIFIRNNGLPENFWKKTYIYFYLGDYKYWTMGAPLEKTILINRAVTNET